MNSAVGFEFGNPRSIGNNAGDSLYHQMGLDKIIGPMDKAFGGEMSDSEIVAKIAEAVKTECVLNDTGLAGKGVPIRNNSQKFLRKDRQYNNAVTETLMNDFLSVIEASYGKKNGMSKEQ